MASVLRWAKSLIPRFPSAPMHFPRAAMNKINDTNIFEEDEFEGFADGIYYPVRIGDLYKSKYQVVGKLGWGVTSTVWLARDLQAHRYVTLKIYTRTTKPNQEFKLYRLFERTKPFHLGHRYIRTAIETFDIHHRNGDHGVLVQKPMWESYGDFLYRMPNERFSEELLKVALKQIFSALDYLHVECRLVHADIKADNILQKLIDESVLDSFTESEITDPSPYKLVKGHPVYISRQVDMPNDFGDLVLSDFGFSVKGDEKRNHNAGPNICRAPEIMLGADWSYPVDIWMVGVMVWDLFQAKYLFSPLDPEDGFYSTRAHLAEVIALLGPPPLDLIKRETLSSDFFAEDGTWIDTQVEIPKNRTLEDMEDFMEGKEKEEFLAFMRKMLAWRPEDRLTAKELLLEPWLEGVEF